VYDEETYELVLEEALYEDVENGLDDISLTLGKREDSALWDELNKPSSEEVDVDLIMEELRLTAHDDGA
jgi:hypothetical protein